LFGEVHQLEKVVTGDKVQAGELVPSTAKVNVCTFVVLSVKVVVSVIWSVCGPDENVFQVNVYSSPVAP
jgi:hypothetical protein